jgi:archaemetzincin
MGFEPATPAARLQAIGSTQGLAESLVRALDPRLGFDPLPAPNPGDWLAVHSEPGQIFDAFVQSQPNRPDGTRKTIYLQPLGAFPQGQTPSVQRLKEYAASFFAMEVRMLPPVSLKDASMTTRINPYTGKQQILTGDVLALVTKRLPDDAFCVLAITMADLYPEPSWNFVFSQASLQDRVGVYSFARYDPAFYGEPRRKDYETVMLRRSCRVLSHETAHMFGLLHCIYFKCVLNGSNHLHESDARPLHLCPVCLRKLQYGIGFDVVERYNQLLKFYQGAGLDDEAGWTADQIKRISGVAAPSAADGGKPLR